RPDRAAAGLPRRLRAGGGGVASGRVDAAARGGDLGVDTGPAAPRAGGPGRDRPTRDHAERDAGAPRDRVRARALRDRARTPIRRRRKPRAAHAAGLLQTELEVALRRPRPRAELEAALRSAAEETDRLTRLAADLLLIARADQGQLPLRREAIAARALLEAAAD